MGTEWFRPRRLGVGPIAGTSVYSAKYAPTTDWPKIHRARAT
jgi:hypothetical protein